MGSLRGDGVRQLGARDVVTPHTKITIGGLMRLASVLIFVLTCFCLFGCTVKFEVSVLKQLDRPVEAAGVRQGEVK